MKPDESKKFTEGLFQQMQLIADYCHKVATEMVDTVLQKTRHETTMHGSFIRVVCLMRTLRKCNDVADFQTIIHANRTLIEIAVDLIMLLHDKTDKVDNKIRVWEKSAKLKAALMVVKYFKDKGQAVPKKYKAQEDFISREQSQVESDRQICWGKNRHPDRWTDRNLEMDVKKADSLEGTSLEQLYQLEYRRMNWFAHGSALTGARELNKERFFNLCGLAYASCGKLALLCAKVILKRLGYFEHQDIYSKNWEEINRGIEMHIVPFLPE